MKKVSPVILQAPRYHRDRTGDTVNIQAIVEHRYTNKFLIVTIEFGRLAIFEKEMIRI